VGKKRKYPKCEGPLAAGALLSPQNKIKDREKVVRGGRKWTTGHPVDCRSCEKYCYVEKKGRGEKGEVAQQRHMNTCDRLC